MLIINDLTKIYKSRKQKKTALDNISLELGNGLHALLGPNGSGKSTLMKLITCNLKPEKGEIKWCDDEGNKMDIFSLGARYRELIGYAPQQQGLYEAFTGYRFLQYMSVLKNIPKENIDEEIERVAASVNLSGVLSNKIGSYSGGMKQRLLLAQAFLGNPKLLIFDEPTVGLDLNERVRVRELIHSVSEGRIVLIATHIVSDVEAVADDVIIMKQGKIVEIDETNELCKKYGTDNLEKVYVTIFAEQELENSL